MIKNENILQRDIHLSSKHWFQDDNGLGSSIIDLNVPFEEASIWLHDFLPISTKSFYIIVDEAVEKALFSRPNFILSLVFLKNNQIGIDVIR